MEPGIAVFEPALSAASISPPRIPVISNVTAAPHGGPAEIKKLLVRQVTSPVLWEKSMRELLARGVTDFLEVGPGAVLTGLLGKISPSARCRNMQKPEDLDRAAGGGDA
jgi:[acyl-carrier-protein] S-malonyltransferase